MYTFILAGIYSCGPAESNIHMLPVATLFRTREGGNSGKIVSEEIVIAEKRQQDQVGVLAHVATHRIFVIALGQVKSHLLRLFQNYCMHWFYYKLCVVTYALK